MDVLETARTLDILEVKTKYDKHYSLIVSDEMFERKMRKGLYVWDLTSSELAIPMKASQLRLLKPYVMAHLNDYSKVTLHVIQNNPTKKRIQETDRMFEFRLKIIKEILQEEFEKCFDCRSVFNGYYLLSFVYNPIKETSPIRSFINDEEKIYSSVEKAYPEHESLPLLREFDTSIIENVFVKSGMLYEYNEFNMRSLFQECIIIKDDNLRKPTEGLWNSRTKH